MKNRFLSLMALAAMGVTLALPMPLPAQTNSQGTSAQSSGNMGKMGKMGNERHPALRQAIRSLERAKMDLQHANHDFGGHRDEAIEAVNNAIKQLRQALQYDKK